MEINSQPARNSFSIWIIVLIIGLVFGAYLFVGSKRPAFVIRANSAEDTTTGSSTVPGSVTSSGAMREPAGQDKERTKRIHQIMPGDKRFEYRGKVIERFRDGTLLIEGSVLLFKDKLVELSDLAVFEYPHAAEISIGQQIDFAGLPAGKLEFTRLSGEKDTVPTIVYTDPDAVPPGDPDNVDVMLRAWSPQTKYYTFKGTVEDVFGESFLFWGTDNIPGRDHSRGRFYYVICPMADIVSKNDGMKFYGLPMGMRPGLSDPTEEILLLPPEVIPAGEGAWMWKKNHGTMLDRNNSYGR